MKTLKFYLAILVAICLFISCKKETDNPKDWEEELKSTTWSGEFQLNNGGANQTVQPLSIILSDDHSFSWFDINGTTPGVWSVNNDKITLTFTNGKILTATVKSNTWSDFTNLTLNGWQVINLIKTTVPKAADLANSAWKGKYTTGTDVRILFMTGNKLKYILGNTLAIEVNYSVMGAGIKFSGFGIAVNSSDAYFIIQNNSMKGFSVVSDFGGTYYNSWAGAKE